MHSAIYTGWVQHQRQKPKRHVFKYEIYMMLLDLDEIDELFSIHPLFSNEKFNFASFRSCDHYKGKNKDLKISVISHIKERFNDDFVGKIYLLTHLRYLNYQFNPLSIYYCYKQEDDKLHYIILEVSNTPWNEQFHYIFKIKDDVAHYDLNFDKKFHVSPFLKMDYLYKVTLNKPQEKLYIHMKNICQGKCDFSATMKLKSLPFTIKNLTKVLVRYPLITFQVILKIYWQALKLWLKKATFHSHPNRS